VHLKSACPFLKPPILHGHMLLYLARRYVQKCFISSFTLLNFHGKACLVLCIGFGHTVYMPLSEVPPFPLKCRIQQYSPDQFIV